MAVIKVTQENFENEVLKSDKPVLVDFNADWCGPCKMLAPTMDAIADERDDIKVVSINIDDEDELAEKYEVFSIPCVVVFKNGEEVNRSVGLRPRADIEGLLR
ncbi:thioredoxin [Ruminococcus sp.]|uniref:thioredoxin n=1 Tax=Ruminococcus sp. TaxID=41978 RepID=UPI0025E4ED6E|nr:thioredoxin [Ruminococcus sp.]MBQ8967031.1 thioredoxin [Ruminococcus sp.]